MKMKAKIKVKVKVKVTMKAKMKVKIKAEIKVKIMANLATRKQVTIVTFINMESINIRVSSLHETTTQ